MAKIEKVVKGQAPSLIDTEKANELITQINGILSSTAQDPLRLAVDSDGKITINFNASPIAGNVCVNGIISEKIFFVQNPSPE